MTDLAPRPAEEVVEDTRRVLLSTGHEVTDDLSRDVDAAIERERQRRESVLARLAAALGYDAWGPLEDDLVDRVGAMRRDVERLDPPDEAGQRRRIDELAARAFGPGYHALRAGIRDELSQPADPPQDVPTVFRAEDGREWRSDYLTTRTAPEEAPDGQ